MIKIVARGEAMPRSICQVFSHLYANVKGQAAVEFALVLPALLTVLLGILELSMMFLALNMLENATSNAARTGKTGFVVAGDTRDGTVLSAVSQGVAGFLDPGKLQITTKSYLSTTNIGVAEPFQDQNGNGHYDAGEAFTDVNGNGVWDADQGKPGLGAAGDVVVYEITYPWPLLTSFMVPFLGTAGVVTLKTHLVVRNEPYEA
jgi:Flp pilus assembly protein TadG